MHTPRACATKKDYDNGIPNKRDYLVGMHQLTSDWMKEIWVYIDRSNFVVGIVLAQPLDGKQEHIEKQCMTAINLRTM